MDLRAHRRQRLHVNPPGVIQLRLVLGGGHGRVEPVLHHGGAPLFRFPPGFLPGVLRLLRPPLGALILFAHRGAPLQSGLAGGPLRLPAFLRRRLRAEPAALSAPLRGAAVRVPALCRAVEVCPGRRTRRGLLRDLGAPPEPGRDRRRSATLQGYPLLRGVVPALGAPIADGSAVGAGLDQGPVPVLGAALGTPSAPEHGTLRCARDVVGRPGDDGVLRDCLRHPRLEPSGYRLGGRGGIRLVLGLLREGPRPEAAQRQLLEQLRGEGLEAVDDGVVKEGEVLVHEGPQGKVLVVCNHHHAQALAHEPLEGGVPFLLPHLVAGQGVVPHGLPMSSRRPCRRGARGTQRGIQ
eukprot:9183151-Pyramimonas_sp.AAC.1